MYRTGLLATVLALLSWSALAQDQKGTKKDQPRVVVAVPPSLSPGGKTKVAIRGVKIDNAVEVRVLASGATARLLKTAKTPVPNNQEPGRLGDSLVEAEIDLPADLPPGEVLIQVLTPLAECPPHRLLVNAVPPLAEKEPNNGFRQPQAITIPQIVEGTIQAGQDVDVFKIEGQEGQRLVCDVLANRLGSPLDASLTLFDSAGQLIASHDDGKESLDPRLEVTLPRSGTYYLSLADVHDQGGPQYVYRLSVEMK